MRAEPHWLVAVDIDDCLMPLNAPPREGVRRGLHELEARGAQLVLASGKPCLYLSGLARGLGIMGAALIGENGAELWCPSWMPPKRWRVTLTREEEETLRAIAVWAEATYGERVFLQPNSAASVTVFPVTADLSPAQIAAAMPLALPKTIVCYMHPDSVDWSLGRVDKGTALQALAERLGIPRERVIAVGNGQNDLPMFRVAKFGYWLGETAELGAHVQTEQEIEVVLSKIIIQLQVQQGGRSRAEEEGGK